MNGRFAFIPILSPLEDRESLQSFLNGFTWALEKLGGTEATADEIETDLPVVYFVLSGGTEQTVMKLRERRKFTQPDEPAIMIAHPGMNSLPASMEILARLTQMGAHGRIVYIREPDDDAGMVQLNDAIRDYEVRKQLSVSRIGRIGPPSEWLVASSPASDIVKRSWGPAVIDIPVDEPSSSDIPDSAVSYPRLESLVRTHKLQAITVSCLHPTAKGMPSGCGALSRLNDEGIIAGCEGDVVSTLGMLWAYQLLGRISWMANPVMVDQAENSLTLEHCSVPGTLVRNGRPRSESSAGVAATGSLSRGPVTLFRIGGYHLEKLWIAEGSVVDPGRAGTRPGAQVKIRLSEGCNVEDLLTNPLGNHLILIPGFHAKRLSGWWKATRPGVSR